MSGSDTPSELLDDDDIYDDDDVRKNNRRRGDHISRTHGRITTSRKRVQQAWYAHCCFYIHTHTRITATAPRRRSLGNNDEDSNDDDELSFYCTDCFAFSHLCTCCPYISAAYGPCARIQSRLCVHHLLCTAPVTCRKRLIRY